MLRPQISLDPVILLISYADLTFIFSRGGRIILAGHQFIITVPAEQDFTGIRHIDQCIIIFCCLGVRVFRGGLYCEHSGIPCRFFHYSFAGCRIFLIERNRRGCILVSAVIISQLDTVHLGGLNILFRDLAVIRIIIICSSNIQQFSGIYLGHFGNGIAIQLLSDIIFGIVLFIKAQRSIGTISGKHITPGIIRIASAVHFISKGFQLFENDLTVCGLQVSIGAFRRLFDHACDDLCQILQCIFRHVQPALRIGDILAVILGHFRNITAQTQGTDGYHRVIGRAVHLLLGGHLCAQLILIYFVRIDIGQIITLHDLVRNSHFDPCPFSL